MELYKKVEIKSEKDLPEEEMYDTDKGLKFFDPDKESKLFNEWITDINWYLQPVEMPTEEEIRDEAAKLSNKRDGLGWYLDKIMFDACIKITNWLKNKLTNLAELNEYKEKEFCTCINKPDVYIESLEPPIARCSQCGKIYKNSKD